MDLSRLASWALAAGVASVGLWLASYSWIIGVLLEVDESAFESLSFSPWLLAEVGAILFGVAAVCLGLAVSSQVPRSQLRRARVGFVMGAVAGSLSLFSLVMPVG